MDRSLVKPCAASFWGVDEPIRTSCARVPRCMDAVGTQSVRGTCHEHWGSFDRA